ncbi:MAG: hypothetical protein ACYC96_12000 [Fimbriimonadaceae bacterium]
MPSISALGLARSYIRIQTDTIRAILWRLRLKAGVPLVLDGGLFLELVYGVGQLDGLVSASAGAKPSLAPSRDSNHGFRFVAG